jgi:membrane protease subunit (stomatin/prohibitin family)
MMAIQLFIVFLYMIMQSKWGAQLTVRESQAAIFVNEGQIADVYGPGKYELSTQNMPLMTALKSWKYAFNSPFKAEVLMCLALIAVIFFVVNKNA